MLDFELVTHLFLQLAIILIVCRCISFFGIKYLKQTEVVCEMIAGMLLGPSFLGIFAPEFKEWLFPSEIIISGFNEKFSHPSMIILYAISHIGLILYMFLVGLEFDKSYVDGKLKKISIISGSGILAPFLLGISFSFFLYQQPGLFQPYISAWSAALYFGIMISITAFPTLARILNEKNMTKSNLGLISLSAASIGDAAAWGLLALVLSCIKDNWVVALITITGGFS
jgi:Kef-type K+ transport system membrane component KefB